MNAQSLIIHNSLVIKDEEFKGISVTSEKWLPIYQVVERDLMNYLAY
jgi:tRNA guanosine-2'-O-methyltransferase